MTRSAVVHAPLVLARVAAMGRHCIEPFKQSSTTLCRLLSAVKA